MAPLDLGVGYRQAEKSDIPAIVQIHQSAFPGFFMTLLGPRFLGSYYRLVLNYADRIFWVKEGNDGLDGFVSGFLDPARFYKEMRKQRWRLMGPILLRICSHPWLIPRLFASYAEARRSSQEYEPAICELSSIAVSPTRNGQGIGKGLVKAFIEAVCGKAQFIVLTTDAEGNEAVNGFYRSLGFTLVGSYERSKGRRMNRYRLSVDAKC